MSHLILSHGHIMELLHCWDCHTVALLHCHVTSLQTRTATLESLSLSLSRSLALSLAFTLETHRISITPGQTNPPARPVGPIKSPPGPRCGRRGRLNTDGEAVGDPRIQPVAARETIVGFVLDHNKPYVKHLVPSSLFFFRPLGLGLLDSARYCGAIERMVE